MLCKITSIKHSGTCGERGTDRIDDRLNVKKMNTHLTGLWILD